jgi:hypothetical protein
MTSAKAEQHMANTVVEVGYLGRVDVVPSIPDALTRLESRFLREEERSFDVDFDALRSINLTIPIVDLLSYEYDLSERPGPILRLHDMSAPFDSPTRISLLDLSAFSPRTPDAIMNIAILTVLDRSRPADTRETAPEAEEDMIQNIRALPSHLGGMSLQDFFDDQYRWRTGPTLLPLESDGMETQEMMDRIVDSAMRHFRRVIVTLRPEQAFTPAPAA